jgi:hypothetical protein
VDASRGSVRPVWALLLGLALLLVVRRPAPLMLEWIRDSTNATTVQAIATAVQAFGAVVLLFVTGITIRQTRQIVSATEDQAAATTKAVEAAQAQITEMRTDREARLSPFVFVTRAWAEVGPERTVLHIRVRNIKGEIALQVKARVDDGSGFQRVDDHLRAIPTDHAPTGSWDMVAGVQRAPGNVDQLTTDLVRKASIYVEYKGVSNDWWLTRIPIVDISVDPANRRKETDWAAIHLDQSSQESRRLKDGPTIDAMGSVPVRELRLSQDRPKLYQPREGEWKGPLGRHDI